MRFYIHLSKSQGILGSDGKRRNHYAVMHYIRSVSESFPHRFVTYIERFTNSNNGWEITGFYPALEKEVVAIEEMKKAIEAAILKVNPI